MSRRKVMLIGLAVSVVAAIAFFIWLRPPNESQGTAHEAPVGDAISDRTAAGHRDAVAQADLQGDVRQQGSKAAPEAEQSNWRWVVACITPEGAPVADVRMDGKARLQGTGEQAIRAVSNEHGIAEFRLVPEVESLTVRADANAWYVLRELTMVDFEAQPNAREFYATLRFLPKREVFFDVRYADGLAYDGTLSVSQAGAHVDVPIVQGRGAPTLVLGQDAVVGAETFRPGYQSLVKKIPESDIVPSGRIELVLEVAEQPLGGLIVHIDGAPDALAHVGLEVIRMDQQRAISQGRVAPRKPADFVYTNFKVAPGQYRIVARCGTDAATATATVQEGDTTELRVALAPAGSVKVKVKDGEGRPIRGAVLRFPVGGYPVFPVASSFGQGKAVSNTEGIAVLHGVPPNEQTLVVEAQGFDVRELQVFPIANATIELEATMVAATGEIVVELENAIEGAVYRIGYGHPRQGPFAQTQLTAGDALVIKHLPVRAYKVFVMGTRTTASYLPQEDVDLAESGGRAKITLDVSEILPDSR